MFFIVQVSLLVFEKNPRHPLLPVPDLPRRRAASSTCVYWHRVYMKALLAAGALAVAMLTSVVSVGAAEKGASILLAQRSRGRGGGRGPGGGEADARSLIRGRIVSVDAATGRVAFDVDGTIVESTLPPARADGMKPGDVVFVTVNLVDTRHSVVMGSVTSVDPQKGTLTVETPGGNLTLTTSVTTIQPGDPVMLRLDVVDIGPPLEPSTPPTVGGSTSKPVH